MIEEEDFDKDEDTNSKGVKKEKSQLDNLGVSNTWHILTDSKKVKKEEKKPEFRGFK